MMEQVLGCYVTIRVRCTEFASVREIAEAGGLEQLVHEQAKAGLLWVCFDEEPDAIEVLKVEALP